MPSSSGPRNTAKSNLVFALDTYDTSNCVTGLGCGGFNSSTQGVRNILGNNTLLYQNGLRISNRDFYTAFGISYPEGNYGGAAASRQGLTPGYNVTSGGKTYDASRSLHLWVWDNNTNNWVPDSYFRGLRLNGHCYDNWAGAETGWQNELNYFNGDVAIIKQAFPNSTWIIVGSHACQMFDNTTINNMVDLGAPRSTINSWTDGSAWREFVLVGTPGLGDNKAYGWAYENYTTNPDQVAHMNLSVTPRNVGILNFDGTDDYLNLDTNIQSGFTAATYEFLIRPTVLPGTGNYYQLYIQENSTWIALYNPSGTPFFGIDLNNGSGWFDNNGGNNTGAKTVTTLYTNTWYHLVYTWASGVVKVYLNGDLHSTVSTAQAANGRQNVMTLGGGTTHRNIGSRYSGGGNNWIGDMSVVNFYNYGLTTDEVNKNYTNYKTRFNVFNPTYRYYEGADASPYLSNWNNSTTYTMADFGGIPNVTAHGFSSGPVIFILTLPGLPTHTKVRYKVYWHLVDSLDNETNQLFIMNSGGGETEILRFTKVYNSTPSISISAAPGSYTWSGSKTYTYRPWAGGAYNADGYIIVDSGWCDHTSSTFTARHVMGADQAQADEAEYLSHVEVLLF